MLTKEVMLIETIQLILEIESLMRLIKEAMQLERLEFGKIMIWIRPLEDEIFQESE